MKAALGFRAYGWTPHGATRAPMPWVAELVGVDPRYGFVRRFLPRRLDHLGARGGPDEVWAWFTLTSGGLYEARFLTGRKGGWGVRWVTVTDDGDVVDLPRDDIVRQLTQRACSAG